MEDQYKPHPGSGSHTTLRVAIISLILSAGFLACGGFGYVILMQLKTNPPRNEDDQARVVVRVESLQTRNYREVISSYGMARALRSTDVPAEVAGVIEWISPELEAGNRVEAMPNGSSDQDHCLIRIDPHDYQQALDSARARLKQSQTASLNAKETLELTRQRLSKARTDLETANSDLAQARSLFEQNAVSQTELNAQIRATSLLNRSVLELEQLVKTATAEISRTAQEIAASTSALRKAEYDLKRTKIGAPYPGRVEHRVAQLGAHVAPGSTLFRVVDLSHIEIPISIPASRHGDVAIGARAEIRLSEGSGPIWSGEVSRIDPTLDAENRTFDVYLDVEGDPDNSPVAPGAFVVARVHGREHDDVFVIPRTAFIEQWVYVAVEQDELPENTRIVQRRRPFIVRPLPEVALAVPGTEPGQVVDGLSPGDLLIVTNVDQIGDGTLVQTVSEALPVAASGGAPGL